MSVEDGSFNKLFPDVVILQRLMHEGIAEAMKWGRANGQVFINDVDDWFWGLDPNNQAFLGSHPKYNLEENTKFYSANVAASDILTVSTPYLADRMRKRVRAPMVIVPNYVDIARFTPVMQSISPTFGWSGVTSFRSGDLETVAGVFGPAIRNGMRFHHAGEWPGGATVQETFGVEHNDITTALATTSDLYPSLLTFDVGIVPLRDAPFNQAKSDIKGLEYAASGIPFIAQGLDNYKRLHKAWDGAFHLADRPKDWLSGIKRYQPINKRMEDQAHLLDCVRSRDIQYGIHQWIELLEGLIK